MLTTLGSWMKALLRRTDFERGMASEIRFHLESRAADLMRSGMTRAEAARQARIEFGGIEMTKHDCRQAKGLHWMDELQRNFKHAVRVLRQSPTFSVSAILILGLCIGANTAIFSVVQAVLFRPLPFPEPERLMIVGTRYVSNTGETLSAAQSGKVWEMLRDRARTLDLACFSRWPLGVNLSSGGQAEYVQQQRVGTGFFRVLGTPPLVGREFTLEEDRVGGPAVTILSHALAQRAFGDVRSAVGSNVHLRGEPYSVVGVMAPDFEVEGQVDLWTPLRPSRQGEGEGTNYAIIVRPKSGASLLEAELEIDRLGPSIVGELQLASDVSASLELMPLQSSFTSTIQRPLVIIWAAVGIVLLIGCVNVAGLLLARHGRRRREMAIRMALGGGRGAVIRQLLAESLTLALAGGVAGLTIGYLGTLAFEGFARSSFGIWQSISLDIPVLAFTAVTALLSSVLFGLAPALQASRGEITDALVESGGKGVAGRATRWPRRMLVVAEVALGVLLLVAAGLLVRTFTGLQSLQPGFDPTNVVTAQLSMHDARYSTAAKVNRLFDRSLDRIRDLPGVESAAIGLTLPYRRALNLGFSRLDGPNAGSAAQTDVVYVTPGFFEALKMPLLRGRLFGDGDTRESSPVILANEAFAERYFRDEGTVGRYISISGAEREIVGLIGDVQQRPTWSSRAPLGPTPTVYLPASQTSDGMLRIVHTWFSPSWIVRASGRSSEVIAGMQRVVAELDPSLPLANSRTMEEVMAGSWNRQRAQAVLLSVLAGLALLLAAVGTYGLIANSVGERKREVGIRLALGANNTRAITTVAMPGIWLAVGGVAVGSGLALATTHWIQNLLWGIQPTDPPTFLGVAGLFMITATVASFLPALRVTSFNTARLLREE